MSPNNETASKRPLRVLHIAFTMNARGTETWLMNVLRHIDRTCFQMDFVTVKGEQGLYDDEIKSLGANLHPCTHSDNKLSFLKDLSKIIKEKGPYDIIHAHPYALSGLIMLIAKWYKIPVRIVHSHTDRRAVSNDRNPLRKTYIWLMKKLININATYKLAVSEASALSLFGENSKNLSIMHCGINIKPFRDNIEADIRTSFNIPKEKQIIGHIGGFNEEKNHQFLVAIFAELLTQNLNLHLLLIGDGPLRKNIEQQVSKLGLKNNVTFTGVQQNIVPFLKIMDVFAFPSHFEGLGLAVVEAQAAGLPVIASDFIPFEASVIPELMEFLPLSEEKEWKSAITKALNNKPISSEEALKRIKNSDFNIEQNIKALSTLYTQLCTSVDKEGIQ